MNKCILAMSLFFSLIPGAYAQQSEAAVRWATVAIWDFDIQRNIVYKRANNYECKLDVYAAKDRSKPRPTLIYIHGGGWIAMTKEDWTMAVMPYLAMGMDAVNVEYRIASISLAPAAVEDCRCALRWVYEHAKDYGFDTTKLVVSGHSAGGHLSLITGMLDPSAGFDYECPGQDQLKVAAIVNFFGITDVADLLDGPNRKDYPNMWLGSLPNRKELAKQVSPLTYVKRGSPPILTIHGDADDIVPYQQAVRLHQALDKVGVVNRLYTVPGGKHGGFTQEQNLKAQEVVWDFLRTQGVLAR